MHFYLIMHRISFLFMYLHSLFNVSCILSLFGYYHLELLYFSSFFYSWTVWFEFEACFHNKHSEKGLIWRMTFHTRIIPIPDVWLVILGLSSLLVNKSFHNKQGWKGVDLTYDFSHSGWSLSLTYDSRSWDHSHPKALK